MNKLILKGRIASKDVVVLKYTQSGTAVASFTVAVNRRFANQDGEREADFINCVAWNKTAEFLANYFRKGQEILLEGRLQVRTYEDNDGKKHWVTEVIAEGVEFCGSKGSGSAKEEGWGEEVCLDDEIELPF
jgi:single-strand DNA-binding protein